MSSSQGPNETGLSGQAVVSNALYSCPVCGESVVTFDANGFTYLKSHILETRDDDSTVSIAMAHPGESAYHPGELGRPSFFVVKSLLIATASATEEGESRD